MWPPSSISSPVVWLVAATPIYFGRIVGSPPGLPGGGIPAYCPSQALVREFPGQLLRAGRARRRISPICRRSAPVADRWSWCPAARWCLVAASIVSARSPSHSSRALAGPFEPVASLAWAEPERLPRWMLSELPRSKEALLFAWGEMLSRYRCSLLAEKPIGVFALPAVIMHFP